MPYVYKRFIALHIAALIALSCVLPVSAAASPTDAATSAADVPNASASDAASSDVPVTPTDAPVSPTDQPVTVEEPQYSGMTASEVAGSINLGWNLGDSLDSWANDAGYDDYHNSNAYQMILRYDNADNVRSTSIKTSFDENNKCTYKWATGLIDTGDNVGLGDIGFEIWNLMLEEDTTITIRVTKARLTRRTGIGYDIEDLLGEHTITITKYGTTAVLSTQFPAQLTRTYGITDGTFEVSVELVDFPQKEYNKAAYFETLRNNPLTTYEMIEQVHNSGFNAVRIPVTYFNHTVSSTNAIDEGWLDRVQEVVDYAYQQGMYCILCMYNDGSTTGWLRVNTSDSDAIRTRYAALWSQIAGRFRDYDERLLFQGFNELTDGGNTWDYPGEASTAWVNSLNQLFIDTVRAAGGSNAERVLVLSPYAGSHEQQIIDGFVLPTDTAAERLIVGVNAYAPAEFVYSVDEETTSFTDLYEWGSAEDKAELDAIFDKLTARFVSKGIPVVIGEFCSADKGNTEARAAHAGYYTLAAKERGIPCFWWDDGGLLLRKALTWNFPELVDAMVDSTSIHLRYVEVEGLGEYYYTGEAVLPVLTLTWTPKDAAQAALWDVPMASELVSGGDPTQPGTVTLVEGVDYDLICYDNVRQGQAEVLITGLGRYSGVLDLYYSIVDEPLVIDFLTALAGDDPQLPFVVMVSFPLLATLAAVAVYRTLRRRERERVRAVVETATAEEIEQHAAVAADMGYGSEALYKGDGSYKDNAALKDYCEKGEYDDNR